MPVAVMSVRGTAIVIVAIQALIKKWRGKREPYVLAPDAKRALHGHRITKLPIPMIIQILELCVPLFLEHCKLLDALATATGKEVPKILFWEEIKTDLNWATQCFPYVIFTLCNDTGSFTNPGH